MTSNTIIFYDIPFADRSIAWSPNTWKTRYCLNYKGLPYKTEWVECPDIEALCTKLGIQPNDVNDDRILAKYTLPVIFDPTTGQAVSESFAIAEYLDKTYPDTPPVLPLGSRTLQLAFVQHTMSSIVYTVNGTGIRPFIHPAVCKRLTPISQEFFRRTREAKFKVKMDEWTPRGEERFVQWEKVKEVFTKLASLVPDEDEFVMGDTISFADFVLAGVVQWCKSAFGPDSEEWKDIQTWDNGKWTKMLKSLEPFTAVL